MVCAAYRSHLTCLSLVGCLDIVYSFKFHGLLDILQQVFTSFEANAEADGGVGDGHRGTLLVAEETEDGGGGVDGQRLAVEEVRGATDDLEFVDERPCGFLRFEVDGEHGTR